MSVRLVGVLGRLISQGDSKTWSVGFESKFQTALWLGQSHHSTAISACRSGIATNLEVPIAYMTVFTSLVACELLAAS